MKVLPAIDLLKGAVVRLFQGKYDVVTEYSNKPREAAQQLQALGFSFVHIVNLDSARSGRVANEDVIKEIIDLGLSVQLGGGIRSLGIAKHYLDLGVKRIILGTSVILSPELWQELVNEFGVHRLVLSLDVRDGFVATHGWEKDTSMTVHNIVEKIGSKNIMNLIVTDISKDGTMSGVDISLYKDLVRQYPEISIIPAGGLTNMEDINALESIGVKEVIIGKALYENKNFIKDIIDFGYNK